MSVSSLSIYEREQCVLSYKKGARTSDIVKKYNISRETLRRWVKRYDGTASSLQPKLSRKNINHPNKMSVEEERRLREIVENNPNITNKKLSELLGTKRDPSFLHRKREKLFGKRIVLFKRNIDTFFNDSEIESINVNDYESGKIGETVYVIEVEKSLYLMRSSCGAPVGATPYFSASVQFNSLIEAKNFVDTIVKSKSIRKPRVIKVCKGIIKK